METEKLVVIISALNSDNPEKATLPLVLATAAQASDIEVSIFLQSEAVILAKKGEAEKYNAQGLLPLKELFDTFMELEGKLYLCSPCIQERNISMDDLLQGSELAAAGTLVDEVMSATSVVTY